MLAKPSSEVELDALQATNAYLFECKYDGIRCLAHLYPSKIVLRTRAGKDVSEQFPDILERLRPIQESAPNTVLDGEIIVYENDKELLSPPSFQRLQTRIQRKTNIADYVLEYPAHYKVFDLLCREGTDMCNQPLVVRRNFLNCLFVRYRGCFDFSATQNNGKALFQFVREHGYEGIIAKLKNSTYIQGTRSSNWLKIKPTQRAIVEVIGMSRGTGRRKPYFGALICTKGSILQGLVGTGFTDTDLEHLTKKICKSEISMQGIANSLQMRIVDVMHLSGWINCTPFSIEVEFQERTKDGKMRFPSFVRLVNE